jgi:hypothetical protein
MSSNDPQIVALQIKKQKAEIDKLELEKSKLTKELRSLQSAIDSSEASVKKKKEALEQEKLSIEVANLRFWKGIFSKLAVIAPSTGLIALFVSFGSLLATCTSNKSQELNQTESRALEEEKFFHDTLEKATDDNSPLERRVAFIWSLDTFWKTSHARALANAFGSMLLNDDHEQIVSACCDSLGYGYKLAQKQEDREELRKILFGVRATSDDMLEVPGVLRRTFLLLDHFNETPNLKNQDRRKYLSFIIENNKAHLQNCDFSDIAPNGLTMVKANFSGSDFSRAQFHGRFDQSNFCNCVFANAQFQHSWFTRAEFFGSDFFAADFSESNFTGANFGGANLYGVLSLEQNVKDQAYTQGAVEMSDPKDFALWKQTALIPSDQSQLKSWRQKGFKIDKVGKPVLANTSSPELKSIKH